MGGSIPLCLQECRRGRLVEPRVGLEPVAVRLVRLGSGDDRIHAEQIVGFGKYDIDYLGTEICEGSAREVCCSLERGVGEVPDSAAEPADPQTRHRERRCATPGIAPQASAASRLSVVSRPTWSKVVDSGKTPSTGSAPLLGLNPAMPHSAAGVRTLQPVSVPTATGTMPFATSTAEPDDEPPLMRAGSCG